MLFASKLTTTFFAIITIASIYNPCDAAEARFAFGELKDMIENDKLPKNFGEGLLLAFNPGSYILMKAGQKAELNKQLAEYKKEPKNFDRGDVIKMVNLNRNSVLNGETGVIVDFPADSEGEVLVEVQPCQTNYSHKTMKLSRNLIRQAPFGMGQVVTFQGMKKKPELNGERAIVNYYEDGMVNVQPIGSPEMRLRGDIRVDLDQVRPCSGDYFKVNNRYKVYGLGRLLEHNGEEGTVVGHEGNKVEIDLGDNLPGRTLVVPTSQLRLANFPHRATYKTDGYHYTTLDY